MSSLPELAQRALTYFRNSAEPKAVRITTPFPHPVPLAELRLPKATAAFLELYEPRTRELGLFPHQAAFLRAFLNEEREDFILTSSTGSGKSLCFWAWVFEPLQRDPEATALVCFPTQALLWAQADRLRRISTPRSLLHVGRERAAHGGEVRVTTAHSLHVLDATPGGNGLSEALLREGRVPTALGRCVADIARFTKRGREKAFVKHLIALRLEPDVVGPRDLHRALVTLQQRWTG